MLNKKINFILGCCVLVTSAILENILYPLGPFAIGYVLAIILVADSKRFPILLSTTLISSFLVWLPVLNHSKLITELIWYNRIFATAVILATLFFFVRLYRKNLREALHRELMDGIFSYGTQSIILVGEDGKIKLVNPFAEQIFQYPQSEMVDRPIQDIIPELNIGELISQPHESPAIRFDSLAKRFNGTEFPAEITMNTFSSGANRYLVVFIIDITHRTAQEKALTEQKKSLEEVNAELETFSYSVSHDLRAPLRAVSGYAKMLEEDAGHCLDSEGRRLLTVIQESARKMGLLIDELLQFSRLGRKALNKTRVDMTRVVNDTLFELSKMSPHSANIQIEPLHYAYADASLVRHVWSNLLSNAVKYSSRTSEPEILIRSEEKEGLIIYSIADNGVGFDMRYAHKLFGVFQRLHAADEFEGTGVGLATAQRIIDKHGGRIWAEGKVGSGATFYFTLDS